MLVRLLCCFLLFQNKHEIVNFRFFNLSLRWMDILNKGGRTDYAGQLGW